MITLVGNLDDSAGYWGLCFAKARSARNPRSLNPDADCVKGIANILRYYNAAFAGRQC